MGCVAVKLLRVGKRQNISKHFQSLTFLYDKGLKQTAKTTLKRLHDKSPTVFEWHRQSLCLSLVHIRTSAAHTCFLFKLAELERICQEHWDKPTKAWCKFVETYSRRLENVIVAKGKVPAIVVNIIGCAEENHRFMLLIDKCSYKHVLFVIVGP